MRCEGAQSRGEPSAWRGQRATAASMLARCDSGGFAISTCAWSSSPTAKTSGRDSDADGVAFTEIVIDDDAHDGPPFGRRECPANATWSTVDASQRDHRIATRPSLDGSEPPRVERRP